MVAAIGFDLINGFGIDYMHCVLLGVMKKLMNLWLDSTNHSKEYYIKKPQQIILNDRLLGLKSISEILRKPKSIFLRGEYKANEYRSMMLYYLRFALPGLLSMKYVQHFQLLSSAIYLLLKKSISDDEVAIADIKLIKFADEFEKLYGKTNVTMNLHLLRHLSIAVRNIGPLWAQSAFGFEANNGVVVKSNTSSRDILHQLSWKYSARHTIKSAGDSVRMIPTSIGNKKVIQKNHYTDVISEAELSIPRKDTLTIYQSIMLRGLKLTSLKSKVVSTVDYVVCLNNETVGSVEFYFISDGILYALINMYEILTVIDHLKKIKRTDAQKIFKASEITGKYLYLKFSHNELVTTMPNKFEKT